jgi:hypothetical protein
MTEDWGQYGNLWLAFAVMVKLAPPVVRLRREEGATYPSGRLTTDVLEDLEQFVHLAIERERDDANFYNRLTTVHEAWVHLVGLLVNKRRQSTWWKVIDFDVESRVALMKRQGAPIPHDALPLTLETMELAISDESLSMAGRELYLNHMFNLAFIANLREPDEEDRWDKTILEAYDICSQRMVRVNPKCLFQIRRAFGYTRNDYEEGLYVQYTKISSFNEGGKVVYEISGLATVTRPRIREAVTNAKDGEDDTRGMAEVLLNPLIGLPFGARYSRTLDQP